MCCLCNIFLYRYFHIYFITCFIYTLWLLCSLFVYQYQYIYVLHGCVCFLCYYVPKIHLFNVCSKIDVILCKPTQRLKHTTYKQNRKKYNKIRFNFNICCLLLLYKQNRCFDMRIIIKKKGGLNVTTQKRIKYWNSFIKQQKQLCLQVIRGIEGPIVSSASHTMNRYVILILCALMLCCFLFGSQFFFVFYVICFVINIFRSFRVQRKYWIFNRYLWSLIAV